MTGSEIMSRLWWVRGRAVAEAVTAKLLEEPVPMDEDEVVERLEGMEGVSAHTARQIAISVREG